MPDTASLQEMNTLMRDAGDVVQQTKTTLNGLPAHLQWRPELDEDHIFPEEHEMIQEVRRTFSEDVADWSDKLILYFLFARRCDISQSIPLIARYIQMLKDLGWLHRRPTLDDAPMLKNGSILFYPRAVDKCDRLLVFLNMKLLQPGKLSKEENLITLVYETNLIADTMPIRYLRNGCTQVLEMEGFGVRNIDASHDGMEVLKAMQGVFPRRTRQFYVMNGGFVVRMVMGLAKRVLPAKLIERVDTVNNKKLRELVDDEWIPEKYGGKCQVSLESTINYLRDYDAKFNQTS
ncbi:hypothetical protein PROFUN_01811 [Planoprotostelium fungivorum]|uniref:CRAL-TRIO domain-containing protein n=1 Tax=Planoprotostelium fungivorum TaxID=1890364 RepID=A0A2P6NYR8_9EUKA|nr:hypothetical protein PROFUN_01811 [Planoprotostelium fungivorum]